MKMLSWKRITILLVAGVLLSSCVEEEWRKQTISGTTGKRVIVSLSFSIPAPQKPSIRTKSGAEVAKGAFSLCFDSIPEPAATRSDGTTKLYNLWIFQFNADGTRNGTPTKISDAQTAINDMITLDVHLTVAENQTLYLVALGPKLDEDLRSVMTQSELEKLEIEYTSSQGGGTKSAITEESEIPFAGSVSGIKVLDIEGEERGLVEYNKPDGFIGSIPIRRLMAKIALRYKFDVTGYKLEGLKLVNTTKRIRIVNPDKNSETDTYITLDPALSEVDPDGYLTATWFVAQNRQGDVLDIKTEPDRYYKVVNGTVSGTAPPLGSFIEAWANKDSDENGYAIYQMYLGMNNTNNFDVLGNSVYNLRTIINADLESASNDGRIREYSAIQKIYLVSSSINNWVGGTKPKAENKYDIDAHPDWRPIVINTKGTTINVGIYTDPNGKFLADHQTSWLKLSSSPNYTEAINNHTEPLTTKITTQTILPVQLNFYLYADEYIPSSTDDLASIEKSLPKRRTLYVKAVTTKASESGDIVVNSGIFKMDQRMGVYVGAFGGAEKEGSYTEALLSDCVEENKFKYTEEKDDPNIKIPWGYTNATFSAESPMVKYSYNGLEATKYLAENSGNNTLGTTNVKEPIRLPDGTIDLYQYNYYNTYAARYCYDRNRDEDGNGKIDYRPGKANNELKWYLPTIRQLMGFSVFDPSINLASPELWSVTADLTYKSYKGSTSGPVTAISRNKTNYIRCVRDVSFDNINGKKSPKVNIHTDERGNKYARINSTDHLRDKRIEDRKNNPNFWKNDIRLFLYAIGGINAVPVLDTEGNQILVTRPIRNFSGQTNLLISSDIAVASVDLPNTTVSPNSQTFNWATASGYLETANSTDHFAEASATNHGCASYTGKDGKDAPGTWRLPLLRETLLLMLFEEAMLTTAAETGFEKLLNARYWTATENSTTESYRFSPIGAPSWEITGLGTNAFKTKENYVRCIKDIQPTP